MAKFHHIWSCYIKLLSKVILHKPAPPMCFASLLTLTIRIRNWMAIRMMNMLACRCLAGWYSCWLVLLRRHASLWMRISWSGWHGSRLLRLSRSRGLRYPNHLIMNWKQRTTSIDAKCPGIILFAYWFESYHNDLQCIAVEQTAVVNEQDVVNDHRAQTLDLQHLFAGLLPDTFAARTAHTAVVV